MRRCAHTLYPILIALTAGGCYRYVPATSPEPGRLIRAAVTPEGADALTSRLGPGVLELDGLLLSSDGQELSVRLDSYVTRLQGNLAAGREPVRVPRRHLTTVLERRIDPLRSAVFGVALAGGAFAMAKIFGPGGIVFEDDDEEPPGPVEIVAPRLRFGWLVFQLGGRSP